MSIPPELADPVEQLRAKLVEINGSEQSCMTDAVDSASQGKSLPEVQAIMARCRQKSATAAAKAINAFRGKCFGIDSHATSLPDASILVDSVSAFWARSESYASALASEAAAQLSAQGPDKTSQAIKGLYSDRTSSINHYFARLP